MNATYNWAYKPGITNKYGFTIPSGADNLRPSGFVYVALFGNDATGNGSRLYPYKTITKAVTISGATIILGAGVYREMSTLNSLNPLIGDGDVVIDFSYIVILTSINLGGCQFCNIKFKGDGASSYITSAYIIGSIFTDCKFDGCFMTANQGGNINTFVNCVIANYTGLLFISGGGSGSLYRGITFYNCNNIQISAGAPTLFDMCIFYACNINIANLVSAKIQYSLLYSCNFKLAGTGNTGPLYPAGTPAGYIYYSTMATLQAAYYEIHSVNGFYNCAVADPLFNNVSIGDFTLSFVSPAKNLSYFGTYVGAKSIAYPVKVSAIESSGDFEFSSAINLTIGDNSITLTNTALDAQIDTKVIVNALGREIANFPTYGFNADRNGQYIDSIADLDTVVRTVGDTLTVPASYLVENGAIIYNGVTYTAGLRFTTVAGQTTFSSGAGGLLREILEAPQRHTIMARFSDGGAIVSAETALITGYYYYVLSGSVTYNNVVYNTGSVLKAIDANPFSGSGNIIVAFSTESYQHYELV